MKINIKLALIFFCFHWLLTSYFYQGTYQNELSHIAIVKSFATNGTFSLQGFGKFTADTIKHNGETFSNKAPGLALLSIPPWFVTWHLVNNIVKADPPLVDYISHYFVRCLTVGLLSALSVAILFLLGASISKNRIHGALIALAYGIASIALPYSTLYMSHQVSATFALTAFALLYYLKVTAEISGRKKILLIMLAAFLAGYAAIIEYPLILATFLITLYAFASLKSRLHSLVFIIFIGLGFAPHLLYSFFAFGDPFFIPYNSYAIGETQRFEEHASGVLGVGLPKLAIAYKILFSPERGLLFFNPWFLLVLPAIFFIIRQKQNLPEYFLFALIALSFISFNSGYGNHMLYWGGGAGTGPRHIIPMLPFLSLLVLPVLQSKILRSCFLVLTSYSAVVMFLSTASDPRASWFYRYPLRDLFLDFFSIGQISASIGFLFSDELITKNSVAFNWAKLLGAPEFFQLFPVYLLLIVFGFLIYRYQSELQLKNPILISLSLGSPALILLMMQFIFLTKNWIPTAEMGVEVICKNLSRPKTRPHTLNFKHDTFIYSPRINFFNTNDRLACEWKTFVNNPNFTVENFRILTNDKIKFFINNELVFSNLTNHRINKEINKKLEPGLNEIRIETEFDPEKYNLRIFWKKPNQGFHVIPKAYLLSKMQR